MNKDDEVTFKGLFLPFTTKKAIVFIFLIGFIVFFFSLFNGFVADDDAQVVNNLSVHAIYNIPQFFTGGTFYNGSAKLMGVYYKPLLTSFFAIEYSIFGQNAFAFHFIQILFHILNTCVLFLFFSRFFKRQYSFLLSLFFLVHPLNSEAVLYISAMQEVLFFFFGILAIYIISKMKSKLQLVFVFPLLIFSLFSKETGFLFTGICLVYLFLFKRKFFVISLIVLIFVPIIYLLLRNYSIGLVTVANNSPIDLLGLPLRMLNAPEIIFFYLKSLFLPTDFALTYQWVYTSISINHFFIPLILDFVFICLSVGAGYLTFGKSKKYFKIYIFFATWVIVGMLFHLQIFPLDQTVADRWFYFPIVGLLGMLGVLFEVFNLSLKNKWIFSFLLIILTILSIKTIVRGYDWHDNLTLYKHDIKVSKESFALESVLGLQLMKQGNLKEAKSHIENSITLFPYFSNYDALGELYVAFGDYEKAKQAYEKALVYGDYYIIYEDLAGLTLVTGDYKSNLKIIEKGLAKYPQDSRLWLYLAIISYQNNDIDLAKQAIIKAYLFDKTNPEIPNNYNAIMNNQPLNLKINKLPK
jgi:Flp pilus assembly protein TadD